jgi:hypothetical protein
MNAHDLNTQLLDAVERLRASQDELEKQAVYYADAEKKYRMAKATAYLASSGTVNEREARAENAINDLRYTRDLAEGLKMSALEAVRGNRTVVSAVQTLAGLYKEEAAFGRTGPVSA